MPALTCSATRAEVNRPSARITSSVDGTPCSTGNTPGTTKYQRKICTSSGTLRNNSTQALPMRTSQGLLGSVRMVPMTRPATSATTSADSATVKVQPQAERIQLRYVWSPPLPKHPATMSPDVVSLQKTCQSQAMFVPVEPPSGLR